MAELQAFFFDVFIGALAIAVSHVCWIESASEQHPVRVLAQRQPSYISLASCTKISVNVSFYEVTVESSNSSVVYRRAAVRYGNFQFAINSTMDFYETDFYACAKATTAGGLEAFSYNGSCTGYHIDMRFLNCKTGDFVLHVRIEYFDNEASVVPFDEAPYKVVNDRPEPYYVYFVHDVVLFADNAYVRRVTELQVFGDSLLIARSSGDFLLISTPYYYLDLRNCVTNSVYGLPTFFTEETNKDLPHSPLYFLNECGSTIRMDNSVEKTHFLFSHAGFGCDPYPEEAPSGCTVTLATNKPILFELKVYWAEAENGCEAFVFNITARSSVSGESKTVDGCNIYGEVFFETGWAYDRTMLSVSSHPTKTTVGFAARISVR